MEENNFIQEIIKLSSSGHAYWPENYVISSSNERAVTAVLQDNLGFSIYPDILLIRGPASCGKTFLAHFCAKKRNGVFIRYAEDLNKIESPIYLIDDADDWDEAELFHAINLANENKKKLIIFSLLSWQPSLKDLASRIKSIRLEKIEELDDELMQIIIASEFSKRSLVAGKEIINYLNNRLPRNFASVIASIDKIDKFCLEYKRNITIKAISEVLQK